MLEGHLSACRKKPEGNAWTAADGLGHTWPVAAIAIVARIRLEADGGDNAGRWRLHMTQCHAGTQGSDKQDRKGQSYDFFDQRHG